MSKVIFMIGLPGSGKSTIAEEIAKREKAVILSTDSLRKELLFDETKQRKTSLIYRELYDRANSHVKSKVNVVIDATNIERERRMKAIKKFKEQDSNVLCECYYVSAPYELCLDRNKNRKRKVEERILSKMRKNLDFPLKNEGWDSMHFQHANYPYGISKEVFLELIQSEAPYDVLYNQLKDISIFGETYLFNQENPFHTLTLCRHTYGVLEYVNAFYEEEDKLLLQLAAVFHDLGKPFCKTFKKMKGYYSYFGHEKVSSQIAFHFLTELGFEEDTIQNVIGIIEMHMKINYGGNEGASEIYHLLGAELLSKLYFFREADVFAK